MEQGKVIPMGEGQKMPSPADIADATDKMTPEEKNTYMESLFAKFPELKDTIVSEEITLKIMKELAIVFQGNAYRILYEPDSYLELVAMRVVRNSLLSMEEFQMGLPKKQRFPEWNKERPMILQANKLLEILERRHAGFLKRKAIELAEKDRKAKEEEQTEAEQ